MEELTALDQRCWMATLKVHQQLNLCSALLFWRYQGQYFVRLRTAIKVDLTFLKLMQWVFELLSKWVLKVRSSFIFKNYNTSTLRTRHNYIAKIMYVLLFCEIYIFFGTVRTLKSILDRQITLWSIIVICFVWIP